MYRERRGRHDDLLHPPLQFPTSWPSRPGRGIPNIPCLSRTHAPSSCVPCADFSPWLRERVRPPRRRGGRRVSVPDPGGQSRAGRERDGLRANYAQLADRILTAPLDRHLNDGNEAAYLDLQVSLILLAVHEGFSGFIMTGEAADFLAAVMAPHPLAVCEVQRAGRRAQSVRARDGEGDELLGGVADARARQPPSCSPRRMTPSCSACSTSLSTLPLGARAHAVDAIRHLSAHPHVPKTLASLSRYETRKRGLEVADSSRLILETRRRRVRDGSGWVARQLDAAGSAGIPGAERRGRAQLVGEGAAGRSGQDRMRGAVARADGRGGGGRAGRPSTSRAPGCCASTSRPARECWRVWLAFGTGIA